MKNRFKIHYTGETYRESDPIPGQNCTSITFRNLGAQSVTIKELDTTISPTESLELSNEPGGVIDQTFNPIFSGVGSKVLNVLRAFTEIID